MLIYSKISAAHLYSIKVNFFRDQQMPICLLKRSYPPIHRCKRMTKRNFQGLVSSLLILFIRTLMIVSETYSGPKLELMMIGKQLFTLMMTPSLNQSLAQKTCLRRTLSKQARYLMLERIENKNHLNSLTRGDLKDQMQVKITMKMTLCKEIQASNYR